jgi:hypothetical protein
MVKGLVTNQTGSVVFSNQQQKLLAGDTINIAGYGEKYIADIAWLYCKVYGSSYCTNGDYNLLQPPLLTNNA